MSNRLKEAKERFGIIEPNKEVDPLAVLADKTLRVLRMTEPYYDQSLVVINQPMNSTLRSEVLITEREARRVAADLSVRGIQFETTPDIPWARRQRTLKVGKERWETVATFEDGEVWRVDNGRRIPLDAEERERVNGLLTGINNTLLRIVPSMKRVGGYNA